MRSLHALVVALAFVTLACGDPEPPPPDAGEDARAVCASDAECDDGLFCNGAEACMPDTPGATSSGCVAAEPPCMASQRCAEAERRCVTSCAVAPDADGDGADATECGGTDCDDADADRFPGNAEICDAAGHDEDCDASTFGERDADGDGFFDAACCNVEGDVRTCGDDCNDMRRDSHPGASEACEGIDNDCDGAVDETLRQTGYRDADFDLHGVATESMDICPGTPGWSLVSDDCDDTSPVRHGAQVEICDEVDNDCDGMIDEAPASVPWFADEDGDLFGDGSSVPIISCVPIAGRSTRASDCDDGDASVHPGAREVCNGIDDDCNGIADAPGARPGDTEDDDGDGVADRVCGGSDCDDSSQTTSPDAQELCNGIDDDCDGVVDGESANALWYLDLDGDGFGDSSSTPIESCDPQPMRIPRGGDCDDRDASVRPRIADGCDGVDQDCDGRIDENGIRFAFFPDADGDGWGDSDPASMVFRCVAPAGTVARTGDCADTDAARHPGAPEQCQSLDDDCDGAIDEDSDRSWYVDLDGDGVGAGTAIVACMAPAGRVDVGGDCDDGDPGLFPGNAEICDGADDDCDGVVDDGADADCAGRANATGVCTSGACVLTCATGYADCDGALATGCEADTRRSATYCGSCTNACGPADTCGTTMEGVCDGSPIVRLASLGTTTFAVRATGGAVAWGATANGVSTFTSDRDAPVATSLRDIAEISVGTFTACARTRGRRVLCWGNGAFGALGDGTVMPRVTPGLVPGLTDVVDVDAGHHNACAVRTDGTVWCWGNNDAGQIGVGDRVDRYLPTQVVGINDAVEVVISQRTSCARRGAAGAYVVTCWGNNNAGQLGIGVDGDYQLTPGVNVMGLPSDVVGLSEGHADATCARTSDGRALCWGDAGQLPFGPGSYRIATEIAGHTGIVEIAITGSASCFRKHGSTAGTFEVWCWGGDSVGWGGGGTGPRRATGAPADTIAIATGLERWCAARSTGAVVCQGHDGAGALGDGAAIVAASTPTDVLYLP